ncbi:MAG: PH domain-containing protein, partial [Clostridia bacterium]|nr:PH domain-containing protein [Clostridia bacterium]
IQWLLLPGLCGGIVVAGICLNGVLAFLHTALDWNSRIVSVQRGGFRRTLYRIRTNAVQEVRFRTDPFRAVCGLGTYYVHFHGPNDCNLSVGGHLPEDFFEPLADTVEN